ncbi:MAG: hypothetical protein KDJ52_18315, partial [Anaerolineae bacterium]|nr:hypothetical protein [Anaerolineae bacterium]
PTKPIFKGGYQDDGIIAGLMLERRRRHQNEVENEIALSIAYPLLPQKIYKKNSHRLPAGVYHSE